LVIAKFIEYTYLEEFKKLNPSKLSLKNKKANKAVYRSKIQL